MKPESQENTSADDEKRLFRKNPPGYAFILPKKWFMYKGVDRIPAPDSLSKIRGVMVL